MIPKTITQLSFTTAEIECFNVKEKIYNDGTVERKMILKE